MAPAHRSLVDSPLARLAKRREERLLSRRWNSARNLLLSVNTVQMHSKRGPKGWVYGLADGAPGAVIVKETRAHASCRDRDALTIRRCYEWKSREKYPLRKELCPSRRIRSRRGAQPSQGNPGDSEGQQPNGPRLWHPVGVCYGNISLPK